MNSTEASKPKLVYITSRFPYPIEKGDKLRAYYQLRDLSAFWDIHLIAISDVVVKSEWKQAIAPFCKEMHIFEISKWLGYFRVALGLFGRRPLQCYYFKSLQHHREIRKLLEQIQPDHIFAQLIRSTEFVKDYHKCPKTIDYMDALSAGIQKRIELAPIWLRWIYKTEWRRLLTYEHVIYEYFEKHVIISEQDRDLILHPKRSKIHVVPNGVGEQFLNRDTNTSTKKFDLCFVGNLSYAPNIEAVKFIADALIPELHRRNISVKILISGADPGPELMKRKHLFEITGWVADITSSYAQSKIFVAPMFIGTGLQNKLLEAMAMGLPCVTTPLAFKALNCPDDLVKVASDANSFADAVEELLILDLSKLGKNARAFILQNFDWKSINMRLNGILKEL